MSKAVKYMSMSIKEPNERIRYLSTFGNTIEMDPNTPVTRYYRSGTEMLRMAQVYLSEGNHENAFILYMKYMTLFLEKIRSHPDHASIKNELKIVSKRIKEEIMPVTEKLKARLLERFQKEYEQFLANREAEKAKELEREREKQRQRNANNSSGGASLIPVNLHVQIDPSAQPTAPDMSLLDQVVYPHDFPTGTNRSHLPNSGLWQPSESNDKDANKSTNSIGGGGKPAFDRTQKPQYERSDSLLAGSLRTVVIPQNTMDVFLHLAEGNTSKNVETCGILAGHLAQNRLYITHMILPKQYGTADSCHTMKEEELFEVQDQQNLITLGWIHTHPSQTAFLSSVDLHTHCAYQIMMPEAVAIVCAPTYKTTGFYVLTPNYGLDFIAQCRQNGFHPHPNDPPLYKEADHIKMDSSSKIEVVDLRR